MENNIASRWAFKIRKSFFVFLSLTFFSCSKFESGELKNLKYLPTYGTIMPDLDLGGIQYLFYENTNSLYVKSPITVVKFDEFSEKLNLVNKKIQNTATDTFIDKSININFIPDTKKSRLLHGKIPDFGRKHMFCYLESDSGSHWLYIHIH